MARSHTLNDHTSKSPETKPKDPAQPRSLGWPTGTPSPLRVGHAIPRTETKGIVLQAHPSE